MDNIKSGFELKEMTTRIVCAYVSANQVAAHVLPDVIAATYAALIGLGNNNHNVTLEKSKPAISVAKSVTDDFIVCLEDGKRLKMLKRYLRSNFGLSPEDYRKKWGLAPDYPMVAPNYAKRRSEFAKQIGLGRGVRAKV
ncbi:MAG: transcriptional regulator MucR [Hyphomonadaceae bacterium]|nr:MAG: transcriptional regulator MucR [Hyphomonadaceae bacterium]KAF0186421.1 MAG: transcriptional regulator MucR [Hyphomonadaceae bacterium]